MSLNKQLIILLGLMLLGIVLMCFGPNRSFFDTYGGKPFAEVPPLMLLRVGSFICGLGLSYCSLICLFYGLCLKIK